MHIFYLYFVPFHIPKTNFDIQIVLHTAICVMINCIVYSVLANTANETE